MNPAWLLVPVLSAMTWMFPSPSDKSGWGLRMQTQSVCQPFLTRESIWQGRLEVMLINQTKDERKYIPLETARKIHDLRIVIVSANGSTLPSFGHSRAFNRDAFPRRSLLPAGRATSHLFGFEQLGYSQLPGSGEYEMRASLQLTDGIIDAPAIKLKVVEHTSEDVLVSQSVLLEGQSAKWSKERQPRAFVQQIKIGNRTWLFYRKFSSPEFGGEIESAFRIVELPEKCEMRVEGSFGDWNPLTIVYKEHS